MIKAEIYKGRKIGVFGLGKTGIAVINSLKIGGAQIIAWDDSKNKREELCSTNKELESTLADLNDSAWQNIEKLVLSPGIPLHFPKPHYVVSDIAKKINCPIICDIEVLYESCPEAYYIGITGTNGKSTTTSLIGHIFEYAEIVTQVGGNIGVPALELKPLKKSSVYVLEISSFQLDLLDKTKFRSAVLLNITPDHIDRHGNFENYISSKKSIFKNHDKNCHAIIGVDNEYSRRVYEELKEEDKTNLIPFSTDQKLTKGISVIEGIIYDNYATKKEYNIGKLKNLIGKHNEENIGAAFAVAISYGIEANKVIEAIKTFPGLHHRLEYVDEIDGVIYINDSKATNAEATEKALLACNGDIYIILGGVAKIGGINSLKPLFHKIKYALLIGDAENDFAQTLSNNDVPYIKCGNLSNAFKDATKLALTNSKSNNPIVLLSPACASFDQWKSFEERGDGFKSMVYNLLKTK